MWEVVCVCGGGGGSGRVCQKVVQPVVPNQPIIEQTCDAESVSSSPRTNCMCENISCGGMARIRYGKYDAMS